MNLIENKIIIKNENFIKKISKSEIKDGINCYENFFIYKKEDKYLAYDRICDHNGGRLIYNYKKIQSNALCIIGCSIIGLDFILMWN